MKKFLRNYTTPIAILGYLFITSCSNTNKQADLKTTPQDKALAQNKTIENMQIAYKGEMTATAKYKAYAIKAATEGYPNIAILYNAVSAAENIHAINHKAVIEDVGATVPIITPEFKVKTTKENLNDDISREAYEAKTMYPDFLKTAEIADNQTAFLSLTYAMRTELKHKFFFEQSLGDINSNTLKSLPLKYFVCPVCGNTYATVMPKHCDFSFTAGENFILFQ
jgi:rubrerythrin